MFSLPDSKFFLPNGNFLAFMEPFRGNLIYDIGCGCGHVSRLLNLNGFDMLAIDANYRDSEEFPIVRKDATSMEFAKDSVIMMCRPCHGNFPGMVMESAIESSARWFVYVGLEKNVYEDLGCFVAGFEDISAGNLGEDGEVGIIFDLSALRRIRGVI